MKKIYTLFLFIALVTSVSAQILQRNENWPNVNWTVTGAYTPAALIFNPTVNDKFKYDASLAVPLGGSATVYIESPVFSLKPAFDGGEKAFRINVYLSFSTNANGVLFFQYWDADSSSWVVPPDGTAPAGSNGDYTNCTNNLNDISLDFSTFSTNQLLNFRYRFGINDAGSQMAGVCISSPVLSSFACLPPTNLSVSNIGTSNATLDWTSNGINFEIEYGLQGFTLGTGNYQQSNSHPIGIGGLTPGASYEFYVRENCSNSQAVKSAWSGPHSFTTATLGSAEFVLNDLKIYPNPTKNSVWIDSEKDINEIKVYNISGQELMKLHPPKSHFGVDLSDLTSGLYFIKASTDTGCGSYKIIKN